MIWALHGFLGLAEDWDFLSDLDLTAIDLYERQKSFDAWATQFNSEVRKSEFSENILLGYSMGGRLALHAFFEQPELYQGAIIISSHPGLNGKEEKESRILSDKEWSDKFVNEDWQSTLELWNQQPVFAGGRPRFRDEQDFDKEALAFCLSEWSLGRQRDFTKEIAQHSHKIVFICGEKDRKFSLLYQEKQKEIDGFSLVEVQNAGHRVLTDQPETIRSVIRGICGLN